MPDSAISPGRPLLRDTNEHRAGAPRRTSPGETAAPMAARASGRDDDKLARAVRVETRWRDIQWVDFTTEPDSGMGSTAAVPSAEKKAADEAPAAPQSGGALGRFAAAPRAVAQASKDGVIPGLAPRFTRLPVPRSTLVSRFHPQPAPAELRSPPLESLTVPPRAPSVVVHPRAPTAATATVAPAPATISPPPPPPEAVPPRTSEAIEDGDNTFPAALSTHVLSGLAPAPAKTRIQWRAIASARVTATGGALRAAATAATTTSARGLARARHIMRRRAPVPRQEQSTPEEERAPHEPAAAIRPFRGAINRISGYAAAHESRLRVSGLAALGAVGVAAAAYIGGMVLAHVAQPNASPVPPAASPSATAPQDSLGKELVLADKITGSTAPSTEAAANAPPVTDPVARAKFYIERAKAGDAAAQYDIGVLYAQGLGLVQDYASAANWFHAAAAQGNVAAEYNLGVLYAEGLGLPANQDEAINWYRSAADREHPDAQFNLALAYASGSGTKQDYAAAARWYQRAAAHGLTPAMINLAILYETGDGVEHSPVDAYAWYSAAGERGNDAAKARATELYQQFNDRDKARAEGLAATIGAALDSFNGPGGNGPGGNGPAGNGPANGAAPPA